VQDNNQHKIKQHTLKILVVIVLLSFSFRIIKIALTKRLDDDSILYVTMAKAWAGDGAEAAYSIYDTLPPLYIYVMALGEQYGLGAENTGYLFSLLLGCLLPIPVFMITLSIFKTEKMALLAAFLAAIHPTLLKSSALVLRDGAFFTLITFALAFLILGIDKKKILYWGVSGLFAGVSLLLRNEGLEILILAFSFSCLEFLLYKEERLTYMKQRTLSLILFTIIFFSIALGAKSLIKTPRCQWRVVPKIVSKYINTILPKVKEVK
jgi:asparagine N-glycosylation enzyme membrane subunit Stt3